MIIDSFLVEGSSQFPTNQDLMASSMARIQSAAKSTLYSRSKDKAARAAKEHKEVDRNQWRP